MPHQILTEVDRLLGDGAFAASDRQRLLLRYLARHSGPGLPPLSQEDIANDILGKGPGFDPSIDPHVRIEISRLRAALARYYADAPGGVRLTIPRGRYRLGLETHAPVQTVQAEPVRVLLSVAGCPGHALADLAPATQSALFADLFDFPLVQDGALQFVPSSARTLAEADDMARDRRAHLAAHLHLGGHDEASGHALTIIAPGTGGIIGALRGTERPAPAAGFCRTWGLLLQALADPLTGVLPIGAARLWPASRLAALFGAYRFMATQELPLARAVLPRLRQINTRAATATSLALEADMMRVAETFGGGAAAPSYGRARDTARRALALDPTSPAAQLAAGYVDLACGDTESAARSARMLAGRRSFGSVADDIRLLGSLSGPASDRRAIAPGASLMNVAGALVGCLDGADPDAARNIVAATPHASVFWIPLLARATHLAAGVPAEPGAIATCGYGFETISRAIGAMFAHTDRREPLLEAAATGF